MPRTTSRPARIASASGMCALLLVGQTAPLLGNPTGGEIVAGSASIGAAGPTLTVNQSTQNAIINWQTFNIANGETTKFIVPNSGAATLNRVAAGNPSAIYGNLQSNGFLYLVNPSGIVVGPNGRIDTAGFMASTLDVSNQQFLKRGDLNFAGNSNASIDNAGTIHASIGDVYLIANQVNNTGNITAPEGTVGLGAGNDVLFQQAGNQHLFIQPTPSGTKRATGVSNAGTIRAAAAELKAAGGNAYALAINNTGVVAATGFKKVNGQVYLTSDGGSIRNSGKISAKQANGNGGTITLTGTSTTGKTSANTVTNSGTLDASSTAVGGKGGTVSVTNLTGATIHSGAITAKGGAGGTGGDAEVSGKTVGFTGTIDFTAVGGKTGNLLIDPTTLTVITGGSGAIVAGQNDNATTIDPTTVSVALGFANVVLNADTNITVTNGISWTSTNTLSLTTNTTGSTININAAILGANGGLVVNTAGATDVISTGASGSINVSSFTLQSGAWNQLSATLPAFSASHGFILASGTKFLRATGGTGNVSNPYTVADVYGLQGIGTFLNIPNKDFQLANNIDASVTVGWGGFVPIGNISQQFQGSFDGAHFAINDLRIDLPNSTDNVGLFGYTSGGLIQRVGLTNSAVTGGSNTTGGLIGFANNCTVQDCYVTGTVNASTSNGDETGGLIGGINVSIVENCYSGANVTGKDVVGGLIGVINAGTVQDSYAYGDVTGNAEVGGLIGSSLGHVNTSYSSGQVTGTTNVGGFMGLTVVGGGAGTANDFWDTTTSGQSIGVGTGGGTGVNGGSTATLQTSANYLGSGWNIGSDPATNTWVIFDGQTRPLLAMEYSTTITNAHQLELIGLNSTTLAANYTLANNANLSGTFKPADVWGTSTTNGGAGFVPIGGGSNPYNGTFDGGGFTIDGLYIDRPTASQVGLFGFAQGTIENVNLTNVQVTGSTIVGGLVGTMGDPASGFQGTGVLSLVSSTGTVTGSGSYVGGLVGLAHGTTIDQVFSAGTVNGASFAGGLIGSSLSQVTNAFSTANVTGNAVVGGLVGENYSGGTISNSYSTGTVSGISEVGAFVGRNLSTIRNSFYDTSTTGALSGLGSGNAAPTLVGAPTSQLESQSFIETTDTTVPLWDFSSVWTTNGDTSTPQLINIGASSVPSGSGNDLLSGTAYLDGGVTTAPFNTIINLIFNGSLLGSTTTDSSGGFSFTISSANLTGGILLTDANDNGNTYYQANTPTSTITGIDIWGATLRLMGDSATTTTLATAKGNLTNGVNYTVNGTFLSTSAGVNLNILSNYALNGVTAANDIAVNHALTSSTPNLSVLIAGGNVAVNANITNIGGGGITLQSGNLNNGVGTVTFGNSATVNTSGPVTIFYNPSVNPAGSAVNSTSYANPTENYGPNVTGTGILLAYMLVNTLNDLQNVQNNLNGTFAQSGNIDASPTVGWNNGIGFIPITLFAGTFNGQGHTINGLTITRPATTTPIGLFASIDTPGFVENTLLTNASVTGNGAVGGLAGQNNGLLEGDAVSGIVTGNSASINVGGLVGINYGTVLQSNSSASVVGLNNAGGLVGQNRGTIQLSYSNGTVSAQPNFDAVGGLVGYNSVGTIEDSYSTASVIASSTGSFMGGLAGFNSGTIHDAYAAGSVTGATGSQYLGGLVGSNVGTIHNTYSTGLVTANGASNVGGFLGRTTVTIENSFFDTDSSGQTFAVGDNSANTDVIAATTAQLTSQTFITAHATTAPAFDFANTWSTVGDTLTPQLTGLPHTALPVNSGPLDTLDGTAFTDSGLTFAVGVLINLISGGHVVGSTTTNGSGLFTFSLSASALTNGVLLTDATNNGNTYYQTTTPATTISGIDIWGSTVRVAADSATNASLGTAIGSLPLAANGINYSVVAGALTTTAGENFTVLGNYFLDGNITAHGVLTTDANAVLGGSANVMLAGSSVDLEGSISRTGALAVTSTTGQIQLNNLGTSSTPATMTGLTLTSAQAVLTANTFLSLGAGGFTATGTGYTSTVDGNGEANGINLFDTSILSSGDISLTGTAGYTSNGNGGLSAGQGIFIGTDGASASVLSTTGSANLSITGTFSQNIASSSLLSGVLIVNDVGNAANTVSVANGRLTITGTVSQGTTTADSRGIDFEAGPVISATGTGLVTVTGTESAVGALNRTGVYVSGGTVSAVDGALAISGSVTRGTAASSIGVNLIQAANVATTGTGFVTVTGNTTGTSASFNTGVYIDGATLASAGASGLAINGNAGAVTGANAVTVNGTLYNPTSAGILITRGSNLSATNTGSVRLTGVAGANNSSAPLNAYGSDTGVRFEPSGGAPVAVTSAGGGIAITGTSGSGAGTFFNVGVNISTVTIQDTGDGAVTVTGFGGAGQADNSGVAIEGATTRIQAGNGGGSSGVLTIIGHGATGVVGSQNDGVSIFNTAQLVSGGAGIVITGNTGTAGNGSSGVLISNASVSTPNGPLAVNSTGGGLSIDATTTALSTIYTAPVGTSASLVNLNGPTSLSGGNFFITQSGNLVLDATTVQSLTLDVTGSISQVGRISAGQLAVTNASLVTLTDPTNVVNSLGIVSSSGGFDFFTDPGLTLTNTVTSGGPITIAETGGPLTLAGGGQVIETGTANIILAAGTNLANSNYFINNSSAGANAVQPGGGNFYLFSSDPTYDSFGGITFAPANMVYNAVYPTSASNFTGSGNAAFFYVAGAGQVGPNNPNAGPTVPNTTTGGAADGGANIVPPVLVTPVSQILPQTQGDGSTGSPTNFLPNGGTDANGNQPPPFSFTGTGVSQLLGQLDGGLANSASNSGQVTSGDIAQLSNGQYNNVSNPQAADALHEALGPIVYANLADALRALGDWADVPAAANETAADGGETILTGGDVAEITGTSAKKIPLSQAPEQLQNALKDNSLQNAGH